MSDFMLFRNTVQRQLDTMATTGLFVVDVDKDELWNTYLDSFPPGTNEIFRERRHHDCSCCKQFIRTVGALVTIVDNKLISIWDGEGALAEYSFVTKALSKKVHRCEVKAPFLHYDKGVGTLYNHELIGDKTVKWDHFYGTLPSVCVQQKSVIPTQRGDMVEDRNVFQRSMAELSVESAETVLELIAQNSIYRGEEHKALVKLFLTHKEEYDLLPVKKQRLFCWASASNLKHGGRFRNTVIGTLLTDISAGMDLSLAVKKFEQKVAPENYKRPTALITQGMIDKAQQKVEELGIASALPRRYATIEDITINNVIYADRTEQQAMSVFDLLADDIAVDVKKFSKAEKVPVDKFLADIVPYAKRIEILLENKHTSNLMSVVAPVWADAAPILSWSNNFSWTYQGEVTDSIKERVKKAGGNVTGDLRCSLSWSNSDDLDIHVSEPGGRIINYTNRSNRTTGGQLDVDMNAGGVKNGINPVENITWPRLADLQAGGYTVQVHNYSKRSKDNVGFDVQIEFMGTQYNLSHPQDLKSKEVAYVAKFTIDKGAQKLILNTTLDQNTTVKEVWGVNTNTFHKVRVIMNSPNHWDGETKGNKHWFFMLENCLNPEKARGLYNEFLRGDLVEHRKVFEMLGSKMKVEKSDNQLSGVGFSSTQKNSVLCKVSGTSERTIEVIF